MNEFYVLKEGNEYYPLAFVSPVNEAGEMRKEDYTNKKLQEGETIVKVKFVEVNEG